MSIRPAKSNWALVPLVWGPSHFADDGDQILAWQNACNDWKCGEWVNGVQVFPKLEIQAISFGYYLRVCPKCGASYGIYESHAEAEREQMEAVA